MNTEIIELKKDELLKFAKEMIERKHRLVIMNGYVDTEGKNVIAYNFDVNGKLTTYTLRGESTVPSITGIYGGAAQWCEEEICEMLPIKFEGLEKFDRLFLPEEFNGKGQILVMPINELKKRNNIE